jgi:uncharacterized OsmC-like protein
MTASCSTLNLNAFRQTRDAIAADPAVGRGRFTTTTTWEDGARARTLARTFVLKTDEPAPLGGTDEAIDPMELVLAAIGTCLTIGWVTQAAQRGLDYRSLRIDVSGDFDLRGYLALADGVRPGFGDVRYTVTVDTDAGDAVLEEIRAATEATSPMLDNVLNATPVRGAIARA